MTKASAMSGVFLPLPQTGGAGAIGHCLPAMAEKKRSTSSSARASHPPAPRRASLNLRPALRAELVRLLETLERRPVSLRVPRSLRLMENHAGMHYHFKPEIFVQLRGTTHFSTPAETVSVRPGEIAIMPTGVPHGERVEHDFEPFRNLVVGFYSSSVSIHYGEEKRPGRPGIAEMGFYPTPDLRRLVDLAEAMVRTQHISASYRDTALRGYLLAFVASLLEVLDLPQEAGVTADSERVFQVKWVVRDQLDNPALAVRSIAEELECSPDYLSHLYHQETGETLTHYINRQRVNGALEALASTDKSIAEIASACGFSDAGYFTRVFRKLTNLTPGDYRKQKSQERRGRDSGAPFDAPVGKS